MDCKLDGDEAVAFVCNAEDARQNAGGYARDDRLTAITSSAITTKVAVTRKVMGPDLARRHGPRKARAVSTADATTMPTHSDVRGWADRHHGKMPTKNVAAGMHAHIAPMRANHRRTRR